MASAVDGNDFNSEKSTVDSSEPERELAPNPQHDKQHDKKKLAIIAGVFTIVIGISIGGIWYYLKPEKASTPENAAELYIQALEKKDKNQFRAMSCAQDRKQRHTNALLKPGSELNNVQFHVTHSQKMTNDTYQVMYSIKATVKFDERVQKIDANGAYMVVKEDNEWRVCETKRLAQ